MPASRSATEIPDGRSGPVVRRIVWHDTAAGYHHRVQADRAPAHTESAQPSPPDPTGGDAGAGQVASIPGDNTTLTAVIGDLEALGYDSQFEVVDGGAVRCGACGETSSPEAWAARADETRRMEGASDPDDMLTVVGARCPLCGAAGTAVLGYGINASPDDAIVAASLAHAAGATHPADHGGGAAGLPADLDPPLIERPPREAVTDDTFSPAGDPHDGLVAVVFADPLQAQEFFLAVQRLAAGGSLTLHDAVIVAKQPDGTTQVRESIDPQPGRSAVSGALWAGLLGLMFGGPVGWVAGLGIGAGVGAGIAKVVDVGIPDEWVAWFRDAVTPGSTSLVLLVEALDAETFRDEVARFPGATLLHTTIDARALREIDTAL